MKPNLAQIFPDNQNDSNKNPKDGDGSDDSNLIGVSIDIALNGYTVTYIYDTEVDEKYVFMEFEDVLKQLRSKH